MYERRRLLVIVEEIGGIIRNLPTWEDFNKNCQFVREVEYVNAKLKDVEINLSNGISTEAVSEIPLELTSLAGTLQRSIRCCKSLKLTGSFAKISDIIRRI